MRWVEAEGLELLLDGGAGEPVEKCAREGLLLGGFEDDGRLLDGRVGVLWDADEGAGGPECGRIGQCEGDKARLSVARFGVLGRLGDVFCDGKPRLKLIVNAEMLQRLLGGQAIGRVRWVGDGDAFDARVLEAVERDGLEWRVLAGPEDEHSAGVGSRGGAQRCPRGDELLRVAGVRGQEDVLRRAVGELLRERGGGTERGDEADSGGVLVLRRECRHDGLQVGCAGELELFGFGEEGGGYKEK